MKTLALALRFALPLSAQAALFKLSSPDVKHGQRLPEKHVFNGFGCTGGNLSPALQWKNPPKGTKSFALTVYDPDAPTGSGWWHWTAFNIPADVRALPQGVRGGKGEGLPGNAVQGRTDFGTAGYGGPCPPVGHGTHRYVFTIYALKVEQLDLDANTPGAMLGYFIHQNKLGKASFTATYSR